MMVWNMPPTRVTTPLDVMREPVAMIMQRELVTLHNRWDHFAHHTPRAVSRVRAGWETSLTGQKLPPEGKRGVGKPPPAPGSSL